MMVLQMLLILSSLSFVLLVKLLMNRMHGPELVSDHNATVKMPMNDMPPIFVLGVWWLGFWGWGEHFYYGVLGVGVSSLAHCPEIARSGKKVYQVTSEASNPFI